MSERQQRKAIVIADDEQPNQLLMKRALSRVENVGEVQIHATISVKDTDMLVEQLIEEGINVLLLLDQRLVGGNSDEVASKYVSKPEVNVVSISAAPTRDFVEIVGDDSVLQISHIPQLQTIVSAFLAIG